MAINFEARTLDEAVRMYKTRFGVTDMYFVDLLEPMTRPTWHKLRTGKSRLSLRQAAILADAFEMTIDELYELSPEINRA